MQSMAVFSRSEIMTLYPSTSTGSKPKNLLSAGIDDPNPRLSDFAFPQTHRRHHEDHVAVLRRQPVMGGGGAVADVIRIGDAAGEREKIAVAQSVRPLLRRYEKILAPARPFQPAFPAQGLDDMVGGFGAPAEQIDDLRPRGFPPPPFGEGQHDPAFLGR